MSQLNDSYEGLFPLPLTSIEKFHLLDHRPQFPNNLLGSLTFEGQFDAEAFDRSLSHATRVQPLLGCIVKDVEGRLCWVRGPEIQLLVDATQSTDWFEPIDLTTTPGLRCYLTEQDNTNGETRTVVWFQIHHAACDGAGAFQFLAIALQSYDNLVNNRKIDDDIRAPNHELLKTRGRLGLTQWRYLKHLWKMPVGLFGAMKFIFRKHSGLVQPQLSIGAVEDSNLSPSIIGDWISSDIIKQLRKVASQQRVKLNTILLTEFFQATHDWNMAQSRDTQHDWIRMVVPMNIRSVSDRWLPSTNRSTVVQVDRRSSQFKNQHRLLRGIDNEINVIRNWHLDKIFLIAIRCMSLFPRWLASAAQNQKCRGAAVWTNMGEPISRFKRVNVEGETRIGKMRLVDLDIGGPVRYLTPVNLCVMQHHTRMRVTMRIDQRQLSRESAEQLFRLFIQRLKSLATRA